MMNGTESLSFWLIVREERNRMEVLTVWLTGRGEALPVFSSEEEARIFCEREASERESDWRLREPRPENSLRYSWGFAQTSRGSHWTPYRRQTWGCWGTCCVWNAKTL